jgi:hypothetical protein
LSSHSNNFDSRNRGPSGKTEGSGRGRGDPVLLLLNRNPARKNCRARIWAIPQPPARWKRLGAVTVVPPPVCGAGSPRGTVRTGKWNSAEADVGDLALDDRQPMTVPTHHIEPVLGLRSSSLLTLATGNRSLTTKQFHRKLKAVADSELGSS